MADDHVVPQPAPLLQSLLRDTTDGSEHPNELWISLLTTGSKLSVIADVRASVSLGELADG